MKIKLSVFLFCSIVSFKLIAQKTNPEDVLFTPIEIWESGLPHTKNFIPEDFNGNVQNWGFVEGNDGIMYVANSDGVLEYDGNSWRSISLRNNSIVWSIAKSNDGTIYVGGVGEFGYLERDSIGLVQYHSLSKKLEEIYSKFTRIGSIVSLNNSVFFVCNDFLFRWNGNRLKVWKPKDKFGNVYVVNEKIYVTSKDVGILELRDETLNLIPNGGYFTDIEQGRIIMMEPLEEGKMLLGHSSQGLFEYNKGKIEDYNSKIQEVFRENPIYKGTSLKNGDFALATTNSGVYIINGLKRNIIRRYGVKNGLLSDVIYSVYSDVNGSVWLGSDRGISRVDLMSPMRKFNNLSERVRSVSYDKNTLFVASKGVYSLNKSELNKNFKEPKFKPIKGIDQAVRFIIPVESHKLVIQNNKVFDLDERNNVKLIRNNEMHRYAIKSKIYKNTIYASTQEGHLKEYRLVQGEWDSKDIVKIEHEISTITEELNGDLWLSTYHDGVYRLKKEISNPDSLKLRYYDTISGLPSMTYNFVFNLKDKLYISNQENGLFLFDRNKHVFLKDTILMNQFVKEGVVAYGPMGSDISGNVWQTVDANQVNKIYKFNESHISELLEYNIFGDFKTYNISTIDSIIMFSGPDGIVAYNSQIKRTKSKIHPVHIRKVHIKNDSLVYAGEKELLENDFLFDLNSMQFDYSLPYYIKSEKNKYQYILEGFDDTWSSWSIKSQKNYTNLSEGDYVFKVRAKNIFGEISEEDSYSFMILPPWYRTWWMYLIYGIGTILGIIFIAEWRSNQLRKKNNDLEAIIKERTSEIVQKNLQLEDQTEQLKVVDKMKTRLFANISHEFRTPLTLIKGPIEQLEQYPEKRLSVSSVKMIRRNANRLLNLVNQLLDLSKLESGNLKLEASEGNVYKCLRAAVSSFSSHAAQRNMDYQIKIPSNKTLWASFDRDKLEKIVYNLLSNAFKFTEDDAVVSISAKFYKEQLTIEVADSGCGIPSDRQPFIFDRFFQVDDSFTKEKEGTGIGLSLTKELVELMKGTIHVESKYRKGSTFKVTIPLEEIKTAKKEDKEELKKEANIKEKVISVKPKNNDLRTILIVEDNEDMRDFIKEQLEEQYQIIEAYNGQDGLKKALKTMPDLIITDLMMPKIDGISLSKQLKKEINTSHIPIIMLTAKAGIENKIEGLETGADDYLTKPFNVKELHVRVKNLIEQRQKLRELFSKKDIINPKEITLTSIDEQFLQKTLDLLEKQFSNSNFDMPQMGKELAMSNAKLHRKIKALTNQSPGELLRNFRLKRAAQILKQKGANVTEVVYDVGFNNLSYFAKCFKEFHGVLPSEFIKKNDNS